MQLRKISIIVSVCMVQMIRPEKGLVIKPIVDLVGYPLKNTGIWYTNMPVAGAHKAPFNSCPRMHQLLYNETVDIIKQTDDELYVKIPNLFYITQSNRTPQNGFWVQKDAILPFKALKDHPYAQKIPTPVGYMYQETTKPTITLAMSWYCPALQCTFSAGTRFVCNIYRQGAYCTAYAIDPTNKKVVTCNIPLTCCIYDRKQNKKRCLRTYNKLLKTWAHLPGFIPYVWGGCSLTHINQHDHFKAIPLKLACKHGSAFIIEGDTTNPKSGFDCAGLIARAAQAAGIPYYYKNTTTIAAFLQPITTIQQLQEGDIIWIPWHVMIVGNLKKHTVIEARHYTHGFGKVHEIALDTVFKDIHTFNDLYDAIKQQRQLKRLNHKGKVVQIITEAKMLSMHSCWDIANRLTSMHTSS